MLNSVEKILSKENLNIIKNQNCLFIEVFTERFYLRTYQSCDFQNCLKLYGDPEVMKLFDYGKPLDHDQLTQTIYERSDSYKLNNEPFGLFSIFSRDDDSFLGQADLLIHEQGSIELGCILFQNNQKKGVCTEILKTFVFDYIPFLNQHGIFLSKNLPIHKIIATAHPDNIASHRIVEKLGMKFDKFEIRFDKPRFWYSLTY